MIDVLISMERRYKFVVMLLLALHTMPLLAQVDHEFWFVVPEITTQHSTNRGEPTFLRISSVGDTVDVTISMPARDVISGDPTSDTILAVMRIPSGEYRYYDLTQLIRLNYDPANPADGQTDDPNRGDENPNNIIESGLYGEEGTVQKKGIKIRSVGINALNRNPDITVYCDRFNNNNKDIWSLKGSNGLGTAFTIPTQHVFPNVYYASEPMALSGFDIVATANATTVTIVPTADVRNQIGADYHWNAGDTITVTLNEGETFSCVARTRTAGAHLGGSVVTSNNPIAISIKDDSLRPNDDNGYDAAGDQIIPDRLAGLEFVVMRGELDDDEEYAFLVATDTGNTQVVFTDCIGPDFKDTLTLTGKGDIEKVQLNSFGAGVCNIDAMLIESDKKILVWHITGFGNEVGGGLIPSIDLCTGSKDVTIVRSSDDERFFLTLMTKDANRDDFSIYIDVNGDDVYGVGEVFTLDPAWFQPAGTTGWYYLDKAHNEFTDDGGAEGSPFGQKIIAGRPTRIVNDGRFHLGTIEGGGSGCKYGYFSSFSADTGSAVIGIEDKEIERYCYGDTIQLRATGAVSYEWWYEGDPLHNEFITSDTIEDPLTILKPDNSIWEVYKVRIEKDCYDGASPWDTLDVEVQVYEEVDAEFDTTNFGFNCCSPVEYNLDHLMARYTYHTWTIPRETDTLLRTYKTTNSTQLYSEDVEFTNHSDIPVYYNVEHITHKNYLCYDTVVKQIKVNPQIVAKAKLASKSGCNVNIEAEFDIIGASGPFTRVHWDWGDGSAEDFPRPADINAARYYHTYTNLTDTDVTYNAVATFFDDVNFCDSTGDPIPIDVPGVARAGFTVSDSVGCSPHTVNFSNTMWGTVPNVSYTWDFGQGTVSTTATDTSITYVNTGSTPQQFVVHMQITRAGCVHDTTKIITVYPDFQTTIAPAGPLAGCNPFVVDFSQSTTPAITISNYSWNFGDNTYSGESNPGPKTYEHIEDTDQNYQVSLITTSEYNCKDTSNIVDITSYAYVHADFVVSPVSGCSPLTVTVTNNTNPNSVSDFNWSWTGSGVGTPNDTQFDIDFTNSSNLPENYTIQLTNDNNEPACQEVMQRTVTVNPRVEASFSASATAICNGGSITFTNSSTFPDAGGTLVGAAGTYTWQIVGGASGSGETFSPSFTHDELTTQQYEITLTVNANGCTHSANMFIDVYPKLEARFDADDYSVCSPENVNFTNLSIGANAYSWTLPDGPPTTVTNPSYTFTNSQANVVESQVVTLTAYNGPGNICSHSVSKTFSVFPELVPDVNPSANAVCAPDDVVFTNNSTGGILGSGLSATWDFDDGESVIDNDNLNVTYSFENAGSTDVTRNVQMTITNNAGCSASTIVPINVWPEVTAKFNYDLSSNCSPMKVIIQNNSINGSYFVWDYGFDNQRDTTYDHGTIAPDFYHTGSDPNAIDTYEIKLIAFDSNHPECIDSTTSSIDIYPQVISDFTIDNDTGCSPLTTTLSNNSSGYNLTYNWNYSSTDPPEVNDGNYTIRNLQSETQVIDVILSVFDAQNCFDIDTQQLTVYPEVIADFSYVKDDECTPFPVTFNYPETALNGTQWEWDFGEGNTSVDVDKAAFVHTFDNNKPNEIENYTITLRAIDVNTLCESTKTRNIEVYPRLIPAFDADTVQGCNPLTVQFENETTGIAIYKWDFADGQSSAQVSPQHIFSHLSASDIDYNVVLTTQQENTGCTKSIDTIVTTYSYVDASFGLAKADKVKAGKTEIVGGCHPFTVEIVDSSKTDGVWAWDFGDGQTGNMVQPGNRTYFNTDQVAPIENELYEVKLQVTNVHGCFDRDSMQLEVYPRSLPSFSVDNEGCHPHSVSFADESIVDEGTKYYWTLGDGSSKVDDSFDYTYLNYSYTDVATFTVKLTTTTSLGCTDDSSQIITVYPKPLADFIPNEDRGCPPFDAELVNASEGTNVTYYWNLGDYIPVRERTELTTETQRYYNNNMNDEIEVFEPTLRVVTEYGCSDTITVPLYVFPHVTVGFTPSVRSGCSPLKVAFDNKSNPSAKVFEWSFGDGGTSGLKRPEHIYFNETANNQIHIVTLYAESEHGCNNSLTDTISVFLTPIVDFDAKEPVQIFKAPNAPVTFTNLTQPGPWSFDWDFGDGEISSSEEPSFVYNYQSWAPNEDDNIFVVRLQAFSEHCSGEKVKNVSVLPPTPELEILQVTPGDGCVPLTVTFDIEQQYAEEFLWEFGDGGTSDEAEPYYTFEEPGVFNVKLTATGDGGAWYDYSVVNVYPLPEPDFKVAPDLVMLPDQEIQTYNLTTNGAVYEWFFGDNTGAVREENPSHLYTAEGDYDIKLIAYSEEGCVDSIMKESVAHVNGEGYINFPNAFLPNEDSPTDGSYVIPDTDNNIFHPVFEGVKDYELWIFNRWGEQLFYSDDVYVGWNGRLGNNGRMLNQDVYFWKSKGEFQNGVPFKKAGDLTLIIK